MFRWLRLKIIAFLAISFVQKLGKRLLFGLVLWIFGFVNVVIANVGVHSDNFQRTNNSVENPIDIISILQNRHEDTVMLRPKMTIIGGRNREHIVKFYKSIDLKNKVLKISLSNSMPFRNVEASYLSFLPRHPHRNVEMRDFKASRNYTHVSSDASSIYRRASIVCDGKFSVKNAMFIIVKSNIFRVSMKSYIGDLSVRPVFRFSGISCNLNSFSCGAPCAVSKPSGKASQNQSSAANICLQHSPESSFISDFLRSAKSRNFLPAHIFVYDERRAIAISLLFIGFFFIVTFFCWPFILFGDFRQRRWGWFVVVLSVACWCSQTQYNEEKCRYEMLHEIAYNTFLVDN